MKNGKTNKTKVARAYNMAMIDNDSAEINMYGDVFMEAPRDWRTGEPIEGSYIAADEFLKDLENIKEKNNITIHINSGGGDLYAGLAIYNRLKALKGTVTTINDGLAASAASLIFQAGDVRKMNAGSNLMAHGVAGFLFGYYDLADLKTMVTEFKAHNKAIINVYAEAMGATFDEAKGFVEGENWLTGKDAVDKGLADEIIEEDEEDEAKGLFNRMAYKIMGTYGTATQTKAIAEAVPPIADKTKTEKGGTTKMDITNEKDLKAAYPEHVKEIENAAKNNERIQAIKDERERIRAIEEIEASIADKELVAEAKYGKTPMTAEQLALKAMQAQSKLNNTMLGKLDNDPINSGANTVNADPKGDGEEEEKEEEKAKNLVNLYNKTKNGGRK